MALILTTSHELESSFQLARALAAAHHTVVVTSSVTRAIAWLAHTKTLPDLIIADVGLRAFGGFEFVRKLKLSARFRRIPILIQTKSQDCELFEYCDGALRKPWSAQELRQAVEVVIQSRTTGPIPMALAA